MAHGRDISANGFSNVSIVGSVGSGPSWGRGTVVQSC